MENQNVKKTPTNIIDIYNIIRFNIKKSIIVSLITALVTALIVFSIPKYYTTSVKLVPEYKNKQNSGLSSLGSAAAMFGINLSGNINYDAISPTFYPEIIATSDFLIPLMETEVQTKDETFKGTYADYLTNAQKSPWWSKIIRGIFSILKGKEEIAEETEKEIDSFMLTKHEKMVIDAISASINCNVDNKTFAIKIATVAQDPLVAAIIANAVKEQLQQIITEYRTGKSREDYEYSAKFCDSAHNDYIVAQKAYAEYADKHQGISRQAFKIEQERLQGEMQLAYSMYNAACQQKIVAAAKLQEETPIFTEIQKASVPVRSAGPRRLSTIIIMTLLSFVIFNSIHVFLYDIKKDETNAE